MYHHLFCSSGTGSPSTTDTISFSEMKVIFKTRSKNSKMAEANISVAQDQFCCSVCLDLLNVPVTLTCGHSYCMRCIKVCWDQEEHMGVYSCPQCRKKFIPRPVLSKNTILAEVVEQLKKTGLQAAPPDHCYAGDVECDVCTGRKLKAHKSCLVCLASYCEEHLQPHYDSPAFRKHKLTEATGQLQDKICPHHDTVLQVYCRTDQQCVCYLCTMDKHRGHDTVSAAAGRTEKQKQLEVTQRDVQKRIQQREKEVQELRQAVDSLTSSAQAAVEHSESIFTQLIRSMERRRSEVKELIRAQEKAAVSPAEGVLKRLEQEIAELRRREAELEKLIHTQDHIHLLQSCQTLCDPPGSTDLPNITLTAPASYHTINKALSDLKAELEVKLSKDLGEIPTKVKKIWILEPRSRGGFLCYASDLTLDPNTAHTHLRLSEGNTVVAFVRDHQSYPHHPERFDHWVQVLSRRSVTGRCYWEVERSGSGVNIAVTYKGINRKGEEDNSLLGGNDQSWNLRCSPSGYYFSHNNQLTAVSGRVSSRIGVYVDHSAGTLSFYSVSDTMTLLHRVHTTFTQPLYAGFGLYAVGDCVKLIK